MSPEKPFAPAADQNRGPILAVLRERFLAHGRVLEIGAGTGQHAVHFAAALPHLDWYPSDVAENLPGVEAWRQDAALPNLRPARALDVLRDVWPEGPFEYAYSANTVHIMHWPAVEAMFAGLGRVLAPGGQFALYGPFAHDGAHTAASNARFDQALRAQDPGMGVRDRADLDALATAAGLAPEAVIDLPANNQILLWRHA
ncbi:DUF938 domain-containing protein [Thioalkalivibrio sp. ALJ16]|uniref:DUF938 domain-containing protein n=1 Tax=Thioalkalivibrio sp. ALJ16 TaxID=1158762 RepID=UPI00037AB31D|nr:DUF938 domain-containing protein [Thioalkalivibrio sp. ALJ16]